MLEIGYGAHIIYNYTQSSCNAEDMVVNIDLYFYTGTVRVTKIQNTFKVNVENKGKKSASQYIHI